MMGTNTLLPYLDFSFTVGVAIHRRQYTFFLSSINDICQEQKEQRIPWVPWNTNLALCEQGEKEKLKRDFFGKSDLAQQNFCDWQYVLQGWAGFTGVLLQSCHWKPEKTNKWEQEIKHWKSKGPLGAEGAKLNLADKPRLQLLQDTASAETVSSGEKEESNRGVREQKTTPKRYSFLWRQRGNLSLYNTPIRKNTFTKFDVQWWTTNYITIEQRYDRHDVNRARKDMTSRLSGSKEVSWTNRILVELWRRNIHWAKEKDKIEMMFKELRLF